MVKDIINLGLSESQVSNLLEFFDMFFIQSIREDDSIDNMDYVCDMCDIYKQLKRAAKEVEKKEYRPVKEIFASINELEKQFAKVMKELQGEI